MHTILLAGQDHRLLTTRAAVLRKTGAAVVCCNASEALRLIDCEPMDLVVLCHSLSEGDAELIADRAHLRSGTANVLMVVSDLSRRSLHQDNKFDAISLSDPAQLVRQTTELLNQLPLNPLRDMVH